MNNKNKNIIINIIIISSLIINIYMIKINISNKNEIQTYKEKIDYYVKEIDRIESNTKYKIQYLFITKEALQCGDLNVFDYDELYMMANRYDLIITNYYTRNKEPIRLLKEINPALKIIMYINVHSINSNLQSTYNLAQANSWILLDEDGNELYEKDWPFNRCVDIGNIGYRDWMTQLILNRTIEHDFDGVLGDNTNPLLEIKYGVSSQAINPRTGQLYSETEYRDDMISLVSSIKEKLDEKLYIGNGVGHLQGGSSLGYWKMREFVAPLISIEDGVMMEGFLRWNEENWRNEDSWILDIETLRELSSNDQYVLAWLKIYGTLPPASDWEQVAVFGITSYLLGIEGSNSFFSISGYDYDLFHDSEYTWSDVGFPLERFHKLDPIGVYKREFTGSIVYVNPTNINYEVDLKQNMFNIDGKKINHIILGPHEGVILFRK